MEKVKLIITKNYKWFICFLALICFLSIAEDVFAKEIITWDVIITKIVVNNLRNNTLTTIMKIVTDFGGKYILIGISILLLVIIKNKKIGAAICSNLVIITILNHLLKHVVQRERPVDYRIINANGYSFPSGHSMVSVAFYGFLIYLIYKHVKNKHIKYGAITILSLLAISIGFSRIYLGVHYASDVVAGFLISISYLVLFISIVKKL